MLKIPDSLFLLLTGLVSGFIDSIAGGGGLINLPAFTLLVGPGPDAIGTNKVAGAVAALVALAVYFRKGHVDFSKSLAFTLWIGVGAFLGSLTSPLLPTSLFRWILLVTCPVILWVIWNKHLWRPQQPALQQAFQTQKFFGLANGRIACCGLLCGFYDGVWGPGGGTFMFLGLLFFANLPLLGALAASKMANSCSAGVALVSYASQGFVHWSEGLFMGLGITLGALIGAYHATRHAALIVRPVLTVVTVILLVRLFF